MKRLGITQRVEVIQAYSERRDCLDQRWSSLAFELGYLPLPLANMAAENVVHLLDALNLDAILLSGGNSISSLDASASDVAPERDKFEAALINLALEQDIPLIGVCRGMQMINVHLGGRLTPVQDHAGVRHRINTFNEKYSLPEQTNSYHNWGIKAEDLSGQLNAIAEDSDGNIEAFEHKEQKILGIMWHPERETPFNAFDIQLIERFLI